ncbi:MAG: DUF488 domain-containing protein [Gammaproteobacteria bacterium]|nr:DUF488 domain-containing protein [Gammaproteobacteria bacterium]
MVKVYTAGHSNRAAQQFVEMLAVNGISELVDVRAHPGSRRNPQFNQDSLRAALAGAEIRYHWAGKHLGGLRKATADSPHCALLTALQGYAEHMQGEDFAGAVQQLRQLAARARLAIMCAERDPEHCHRSLIADYLLAAGDRVAHLLSADERCEHGLNAAARQTARGLVYDRLTQATLALE